MKKEGQQMSGTRDPLRDIKTYRKLYCNVKNGKIPNSLSTIFSEVQELEKKVNKRRSIRWYSMTQNNSKNSMNSLHNPASRVTKQKIFGWYGSKEIKSDK